MFSARSKMRATSGGGSMPSAPSVCHHWSHNGADQLMRITLRGPFQ